MVLIVIVVTVIGAIIVAALAMDWDFTSPEEPKDLSSIDLDVPTVTTRTIDERTFWDSTVSITLIEPPDAEAQWATVRVVVKDANLSVLLELTPLVADNPPMYDNGSDGRVDVQVWHIDIDGDGHVDTGDRMKFTALTKHYEGAEVKVFHGQSLIGTFTFPNEFP
jgi:hypothetical protein